MVCIHKYNTAAILCDQVRGVYACSIYICVCGKWSKPSEGTDCSIMMNGSKGIFVHHDLFDIFP